ncbi:n-alpha-acetyltransferase [Anaeramoeba flamelloides]|uniref:N-alpha-acetyltransferase 60 n=1 Tax=Anaeramoeba flamelloides TaxID=1746091 RepID=A0AAV7YH40_9EUKA|nr:n-alpha-acetyltransferase [Anaeramoeba flamelloides]
MTQQTLEQLDENLVSINRQTKAVAFEGLLKDYKFRSIKRKDIREIQQLEIRLFGSDYPDHFFYSLYGSNLGRVVIHKKTGVIAGMVTAEIKAKHNFYFENYQKACITSIGVHPDHTRKGIGYNLLKYMTDHLRFVAKVNEIYLHTRQTNTRAVSFYQRFGFVVTKLVPGYYWDREIDPDAYIMTFFPTSDLDNEQEQEQEQKQEQKQKEKQKEKEKEKEKEQEINKLTSRMSKLVLTRTSSMESKPFVWN